MNRVVSCIRLLLTTGLLAFGAGCSGGGPVVVAIAINPSNPNILFAATFNSVYKSRDGGGTWQTTTEGLGSGRIQSLAIDPVFPATVYAGTFGDAVYKSNDGGNRWGIINAGMKEHVTIVNQFHFHPHTNETIFAATTVGVFKTTNAGQLWEEMSNKGMDSVYVVSIAVDPSNPDTLYAGTSGGVYKTTDGGLTWKLMWHGMFESDRETGLALGVNALLLDPGMPATVYAATTNGIYKSTNGAEAWQRFEGEMGKRYVSSLQLDPKQTRLLYAGTNEGVFKSTDGGLTWTAASQGLAHLNIRTLVMHPSDPNTLYAGTHGALYKTTDGAGSWVKLEGIAK
jgi:photosystem II stability/assembly factor-like uncharacterized protein